MKKIALVFTQSAFSQSISREAQDLALALAAVEHEVTLIYLDAAVTQLLPAAQQHFGVKDFTLSQKLFALYDIHQVVVARDAMALFQLDVNELRIDAELLSNDDIKVLLLTQDHIVRC